MGVVDPATAARMRARFGPTVEPWLETVDEVVSELTARWSLTLGPAAGRGNTSLVLRCDAEGRPAVLKLVPDPAVAAAEASGLRAWSQTGAVPALLRHDEHLGALVLEAVMRDRDATQLALPGDDHDPDAVTALVRALHSAASSSAFPTLAQRLEELTPVLRRRNALPRGWSEALRLAADPVPSVLLHGDLHPRNVLVDASGELVAIDPRPCVGDPCWDAIDLPVRAADLGLDDERLERWRSVWR